MPKEIYRALKFTLPSRRRPAVGHGILASSPSWGQACGDPRKTDMKSLASGGANHYERDGSHLQAPSSRCEGSIFLVGFAILPQASVTAFGIPLPSRVQPTSSLLHLPPLSSVMTLLGKRKLCRGPQPASFSFLIGTMTSSVPWKFHSPPSLSQASEFL